MSNPLPPSHIEEPLQPGEEPLPENPDTGYPPGYYPPGGQPAPQQNQQAPLPSQQPRQQFQQQPPQAVAPQQSTYFQGQQGEPQAPQGDVFDNLGNALPTALMDAMEQDPNAELPNSLMFPEGLDQEQVDKWKSRYGLKNVYMVSVIDSVWVFRGISRIEWAWVKQQGWDQETFENQLLWRCLLFPRINDQILDAMPAGIPSSMTDYIMRFSGFSSQAIPIRL